MFPERIELVGSWELYPSGDDDAPDASRGDSMKLALGTWPNQRQKESFSERRLYPLPLEEFFVDLCINPRLRIRSKQKEFDTSEDDPARAQEKFPELEECEFRDAGLPYFRDIIGALVEYKRRYEERVRSEFCLTAIGREVWEKLDHALKTSTMVVVEGREGRGKTEAVRAWCNCHLGVARFATLSGITTKSTQFRALAQAVGLWHGSSRSAAEMQSGVEEVLKSSRLMLVVDEAHFFFAQGDRQYGRPELLDWIDTALCNPPLPVALVTTPQFMLCMERAAHDVDWNYMQFKRRCKRYCRLPANNTPEDIEAVTRHLLPGAKRAIIKQVAGYAALSKRDLSAVGDIVREAKLLAEEEGAAEITFDHIARATGLLFESDKPWAEMERRLQNQKLGRKALRHLPDIGAEAAPEAAPEGAQEPPETRGRDITPRLSPSAPRGNRMRLQEPVSALIREPDEAILTPG
jgi:hypothetical protein